MNDGSCRPQANDPDAQRPSLVISSSSLPLRESAISSNRRLRFRPFRPGTFRFRLRNRQKVLRAILKPRGCRPSVRVPSKEYHHIARACDMGAEGIMIPMVSTAAEAKAVVNCTKYYPDGRRGVALGVAHDAYGQGPVHEKLAAANERTTLFSARSRPPKASKMPTRLPLSMASTACGSAISTCQCRLAFRASSTIRNF